MFWHPVGCLRSCKYWDIITLIIWYGRGFSLSKKLTIDLQTQTQGISINVETNVCPLFTIEVGQIIDTVIISPSCYM